MFLLQSSTVNMHEEIVIILLNTLKFLRETASNLKYITLLIGRHHHLKYILPHEGLGEGLSPLLN